MIITFSITLQEGTSLEDAQRIREETLTALRRQMKWQSQEEAVIGTTLEVE
jgi:hypothetical protein